MTPDDRLTLQRPVLAAAVAFVDAVTGGIGVHHATRDWNTAMERERNARQSLIDAVRAMRAQEGGQQAELWEEAG